MDKNEMQQALGIGIIAIVVGVAGLVGGVWTAIIAFGVIAVASIIIANRE